MSDNYPPPSVRIMMITSQWASMQQTQTPGKECHQYIAEWRQAIWNLWCCECINLFWLIKSLHCMHRVMTAANRCEWMRGNVTFDSWSNFIFIKWATEIRGRWGLWWVTVRGLSPPGCAQDNSQLAISPSLQWAPHPLSSSISAIFNTFTTLGLHQEYQVRLCCCSESTADQKRKYQMNMRVGIINFPFLNQIMRDENVWGIQFDWLGNVCLV